MIEFKFSQEIIWAILAVLGGIAKYFDKYLKGQETFTVLRMVSNMFVSGFTGYMTAQFFLLMYPTWALIGAGIGGYAGTQMLDLIVEFLKFKVKPTEETNQKINNNKKEK